MEKNAKIILVIILIALALYFGKNLGLYSIIIRYGDITFPPEQRNTIWLENSIDLLAPSFDSLSCSNQKQFCGCNDGEITISNLYSSGNSLILTSSMSGQYISCGGNYITTNLTLPKGRLYGECIINGNAPIQISNGNSGGSCQINSNGNNIYSFSKYGNEFAWNRLGISEVRNNFSINLNELTNLEILLESANAAYGSGSARIELRFDDIICAENWICSSWSSCSTISGKQTRTCTDSNNCGTTTNKPATNQSCTITCNTPADTNCNNIVDRTELGVYINSWIAGTVTRDNLGLAIRAWVS